MRALLVILLLAAAHAPKAPAKKTAPASAPASSVEIDVASAKAAAKGLPAELVTRVEKFANNAESVAKGGPDTALCSLADEAVSLGADLHGAVADRPAGSLAALEKALPGIRDGGASYAGLAKIAAAKHASSTSLLAGASGLLDGKHPAFIVMKTEERGCTDYSRAQPSIEKVVKGWSAAPPCLRDQLRGALEIALKNDELSTCYCADSDTAAFETKHYAAQLSKLKDFDGPGHAKAILAEVDDSSAHFRCNP